MEMVYGNCGTNWGKFSEGFEKILDLEWIAENCANCTKAYLSMQWMIMVEVNALKQPENGVVVHATDRNVQWLDQWFRKCRFFKVVPEKEKDFHFQLEMPGISSPRLLPLVKVFRTHPLAKQTPPLFWPMFFWCPGRFKPPPYWQKHGKHGLYGPCLRRRRGCTSIWPSQQSMSNNVHDQ